MGTILYIPSMHIQIPVMKFRKYSKILLNIRVDYINPSAQTSHWNVPALPSSVVFKHHMYHLDYNVNLFPVNPSSTYYVLVWGLELARGTRHGHFPGETQGPSAWCGQVSDHHRYTQRSRHPPCSLEDNKTHRKPRNVMLPRHLLSTHLKHTVVWYKLVVHRGIKQLNKRSRREFSPR